MSIEDCTSVACLGADLRRALPGATLASATRSSVEGSSFLRAAACLRSVGVRIRLPFPPTKGVLRAALSSSAVCMPDLSGWLRATVCPRGISEEGVLTVLAAVLSGTPVPEPATQTLTAWTRRLGLPSPRQWAVASRVIHAVTILQTCPEVTVAQAARLTGYSDGATLSHATRRLCGAPPSAARKFFGWEWVLDGFLQRTNRLNPSEE